MIVPVVRRRVHQRTRSSDKAWMHHVSSLVRLSWVLLALFCGQLMFSARAQSETPQEADSLSARRVLALIDSGKILARSVFEKDMSQASDPFAKEVKDYLKKLFRQKPKVLTSKHPLEPRDFTLFREETWAREIVNLEKPFLRYQERPGKRHYTALESVTLLVNGGRTKLYIEEKEHSHFAVGLLFDASLCDVHGWRYVFNADASSSHWLSSTASPPNRLPDTSQLNARDSWIAHVEEGEGDPDQVAAAITEDSMLNFLRFNAPKPEAGLSNMNEILVGLSSKAIKGVFVHLSNKDNAVEDNFSDTQFQAIVEGISRRQLLREKFKVSVPLLQMPLGGAKGGPRHIGLDEQLTWLIAYQYQVAMGADIGNGNRYTMKAGMTAEAERQIGSLIASLQREMAGMR